MFEQVYVHTMFVTRTVGFIDGSSWLEEVWQRYVPVVVYIREILRPRIVSTGMQYLVPKYVGTV